MEAIKKIIEHMDDTLAEADEYYTDYIMYKDYQPKLSSTALEMAKVHLDLYMKWHNVVVSVINDYRTTKGDAPESMKAIWDYEHKRLTECYNKLKYKVANAM